MGRSKVPVDRLTEYLETRILAGTFETGTALPSVRRLAAKFNLSFGTTYRALEQLAEEGWLARAPGAGFRVNAPPAQDAYGIRIAVVLEVASENITSGYLCYHVLLGLRAMAAKSGCSLHLTNLQSELSAERLKRIVNGMAGVIFIGGYDITMREMNLPCPAVGVLMLRSYQGQVSTINIDVFDVVQQACAFFGGKGIVKVVIFTSAKPLYQMIGTLFRVAMQTNGGEAELVVGVPDEKMHFEKGTGYFFTSDHVLQIVSNRYCQRFGVPLAEHHVVLGVDGKRLINPDYHPFPTIAVDWEEMGRIAFEELLRRLQFPESPGRNQSVAGKLILPNGSIGTILDR